MNDIINVTAGLIFRKGLLLISQRPIGKHLGGMWEFPGGKQQANETLPECLCRELREELGVEVKVHELLWECFHEYPQRKVRLHFYRCSLIDEGIEPKPIECAAVQWVASNELVRYEFPPPDHEVVENLSGGCFRRFFNLQPE